MSDDVKYMSIDDFRSLGFLQELNRQFLHPLGLALEVMVGPNGHVTLGGVWDCRDDSLGVIYADEILDTDEARNKVRRVDEERLRHHSQREIQLGSAVQPLSHSAGDVLPIAGGS